MAIITTAAAIATRIYSTVAKDMEFLSTLGRIVRKYSLWKMVLNIFRKLQVEIPYDLEISHLAIYSKELKLRSTRDICNSHAYCGLVHNGQVMKTTYFGENFIKVIDHSQKQIF